MKKRYPESAITVVDHCPKACEAIAEPGLSTVCMDGVSYLHHYLTDSDQPGWVIPVIPVHLVYAWIRLRLLPDISIVPVDIPESFADRFPISFLETQARYSSATLPLSARRTAPRPGTCVPIPGCAQKTIPVPGDCRSFLRWFSEFCPSKRATRAGNGGIDPWFFHSSIHSWQCSSFPILFS